MQRSKLDEVYSLSNKFTREEMISKISNYDALSLTNRESELSKYIDPFTKKVKSQFAIIRDNCPLCESKEIEFLFDFLRTLQTKTQK